MIKMQTKPKKSPQKKTPNKTRVKKIPKQTVGKQNKRERRVRTFIDSRGRKWFDDGFDIWQDDYHGDDEEFDARDPRYFDNW